jgi:hypothetical protein
MMVPVSVADEEYREAEARAYRSMGVGCVAVALAILVAGGALVWVILWWFSAVPGV